MLNLKHHKALPLKLPEVIQKQEKDSEKAHQVLQSHEAEAEAGQDLIQKIAK